MIATHPSITTLHDLLVYEAKKMADAESQLLRILPQWMARAESVQLKERLTQYLVFMNQHLKGLENFFVHEHVPLLGVVNRIVQGFIEETDEKLSACSDPEIADACLLAAIQEINNYKISMYGTAAAFGQALDLRDFASNFHKAELDEIEIDNCLSSLAEHYINIRAKAPIIKQNSYAKGIL